MRAQPTKIGPIEGRTTETLRDGRGNAVGGLVFNILFGVMDQVAKKFQVVQKIDGSVVMKVVPTVGDQATAGESQSDLRVRGQVLAGSAVRDRIRRGHPTDRRGQAQGCRRGAACMSDLYGQLLAKTLFPAFEAVRGRPTVPLLHYLEATAQWEPDAAARAADRPVAPPAAPRVPAHDVLPARDRRARRSRPRTSCRRAISRSCRCSIGRRCARRWIDRTANAPPARDHPQDDERQLAAIRSRSSTTRSRGTGATRSAGAATAGAAIGSACARSTTGASCRRRTSTWWKRRKIVADRMLQARPASSTARRAAKRRCCDVVEQIRDFKPHAIIAYASGAGALARFINDRGLRDWDTIPVLTGAEGLLAARPRARSSARSVRRSTPTAAAR